MSAASRWTDFRLRLRNLGRRVLERLSDQRRTVPAPSAVPPAALLRAGGLHRPETAAQADAWADEFASARPFRHAVVDDFFLPEFCRRLSAEFPPDEAFAFRDDRRRPNAAHYETLADFPPSYAELHRYIQSAEFLALASRITGVADLLADPEYIEGGAYKSPEGLELGVRADSTLHPDTGLYRRVKLLFSLNDEWDESWGGALELHLDPRLPPERNPVRTILPRLNRCVIIETSGRAWHGFRSFRLPPNRKGLTRRWFELSLYTRDCPPGRLVVPSDLAVFVDRPLPPEIKPGRVLTEEDVSLIARRIAGRDWKLEYLYGRAIGLFNQWRTASAELEEARRAAGKPPPG